MKSKKASQTYTAEYKAQAVKRLNMSTQTLSSWVQRANASKLPKLPTQ